MNLKWKSKVLLIAVLISNLLTSPTNVATMNAVINEEVAEFSDYDSDETDSESEQSLNEKLLQAIITHAHRQKFKGI